MILHKLSHRGSAAFTEEITIDFDGLPALIGIHGRNGSGKTTLLDIIAAAFYLEMPFRPGPLHGVFATRGYIDLTWSLTPGGTRYRSRINVDPGAGRTEAVLYPADGGSAIAGPLQRNYAVKIKELLGSLDLFLCTSYTAQPSYTTSKNAFTFLLADRHNRRAIMSDLLGLNAYSMRQALCKDRLRALDSRLSGLRSLGDEWARDLVKRPGAEERAQDLAAKARASKEVLEACQKAQEEAQEALRALKETAAKAEPIRQQRDGLLAELERIRGRLPDLRKNFETATAKLAEAEAVADAPAKYEKVQQELVDLIPAEALVARLSQEITGLEIEARGLVDEFQGHQALLNREVEIEAAVNKAASLNEHIVRVTAEIDRSVENDRDAAARYSAWSLSKNELRQKRLELARHKEAVAIMDKVPCKGQELFAGCMFLTNANQSAIDIDAVAVAVAELEAVVGNEDQQPPASATPALRAQLEGLRNDFNELQEILPMKAKLETVRSLADATSDRLDALNKKLDDRRVELEISAGKIKLINALKNQAAALQPLAALARFIDVHRASANTYSAELEQLSGREVELERLVEPLIVDVPDLTAAEARLFKAGVATRQAQAEMMTLDREATAAATRLQAFDEVANRLKRTQADIATVEIEVDDWTLLGKAMSPAGIPALLIDQALPEIGALATEMLQECLGERLFSIQLITQRASADDKKMLEVLDVIVFRDGAAIPVEMLSGGEGVLVSEALSLAINLYNARQNGAKRGYTLFRDEVSANLDEARAPAYTKLLSRARKLGGFDKVLFVSHHAPALALADARIEIEKGRLKIS